jgi:hypothetical protein
MTLIKKGISAANKITRVKHRALDSGKIFQKFRPENPFRQ